MKTKVLPSVQSKAQVNENTQKQKADEKNYSIFKPLVVGGAIGGTSILATNTLACKAAENLMKKNVGAISLEQIDDIIKKSKFTASGGTILEPSALDFSLILKKTMLDLQGQSYNEMDWYKKFVYKLRKKSLKIKEKEVKSYAEGLNAGCTLNNKIIINKEKAGVALFHEMGHADNHSSKGLGNVLSKYRHSKLPTMFILAGLASALLPRYEGEDAETTKGKVCNFLKDNCVLTTALGAAAVPLEEGMASLKGLKFAKDLSKNQIGKVAKFQGVAWLSYATVAGCLMLTAKLISKFSDKYNAQEA